MTAHQPHDMYYDSTQRSPTHRLPQQNTVQRQHSRQFDGYNTIPHTHHYASDDHSSQQQQQHHQYGANLAQYNERMAAQTMNSAFSNTGYMNNPWNSYAPGASNGLAALGGSMRTKPSLRSNMRGGLPTNWMDGPMNPISPYSDMSMGSLGHGSMRNDPLGLEDGEELIPTAIVIKNIPFAVKKEQLVQLMTDMGLPLPYAFNYHFDNGIFRGLAFANFTTAEETGIVIEAMNHYELLGRKLRVEYKKMLPMAERERIERNKRIQRGQLEEQHQPLKLHQQPSVGSITSGMGPGTSPSPVNVLDSKLDAMNYDLNDPDVLRFYTEIAVFNADLTRESMTMPHTLTPAQRRIVHVLAHKAGLAHVSKGQGDTRSVHIFRVRNDGNGMSPPPPSMNSLHAVDPHRRALNRAATTDFSEHRMNNDGYGNGLARQASSGFLGFAESSNLASHTVRGVKSYADLRSYTPSPVPSTASFPANLANNYPRFGVSDYGLVSAAASNPNLSSTVANIPSVRDENILINGMGNMGLSAAASSFNQASSPRALRSAWDRDLTPGPIGGHRSFTTAFDEQSRERLTQGPGSMAPPPSRQPRGPGLGAGGFGLGGHSGTVRGRVNGHAGRGSDELSTKSASKESVN